MSCAKGHAFFDCFGAMQNIRIGVLGSNDVRSWVVVVAGKAKVRSFLRLFYTTTVTHICLIEHM